jgi:hypothetical protein
MQEHIFQNLNIAIKRMVRKWPKKNAETKKPPKIAGTFFSLELSQCLNFEKYVPAFFRCHFLILSMYKF